MNPQADDAEFQKAVNDLRDGGMDDYFIVRQVADDLVRETGDEVWLRRQHLIEAQVALVPKEAR